MQCVNKLLSTMKAVVGWPKFYYNFQPGDSALSV